MKSKMLAGLGVVLSSLFAVGIVSRLPAETKAEQTKAEQGAAKEKESPLGRKIDNFSLRDYRGAAKSLDEFKSSKAVVVALLGCECPLAKQYGPRLAELAKKYEPLGVALVGLNANVQDSLTEIGDYAKEHKIEFPILKDVGNVVADQLGAARTPEVFVLDAERKIRYRGAIDDQYGIGFARPKPTATYLADALDQILAGKEVKLATTEAPGCLIGRAHKPDAKAEVTYSNQISRILQNHCVTCHREGEVAPFALTRFDDVFGWAETIDEVVQEQRMPPWHASAKHGRFRNDARLSAEEKDLISRWVQVGAPEGDSKQLPPPREFTTGWQIPKPDLVVKMSEKAYKVPASGTVRYQYFVVDPGFKEDKWVRAAEARPGNRAIVHHIIVFIQPPGQLGVKLHAGSLGSDWLVATAPGAKPMILPPPLGKRIPAGSKLIFQVHYTPNGAPQEDLSSVGIAFADPKTVKREVTTRGAANPRFVIPPGAESHEVKSEYRFREDSVMLAMFPHMHLRGKAFRYEAQYPDGTSEILLDIPKYDFNWQNSYILALPKRMPAGTKVVCTAQFDNSERNRSNPNPKQAVRWGDQTWEEMMIGYFSIIPEKQDLSKPNQRRADQFAEAIKGGKKLELSDECKKLAPKALDSDEDLEKLEIALHKLVPQLDRVCLTEVDDKGTLTIKRAAQSPDVPGESGVGLTVPGTGLALATYAKEGKPAVHQNLPKEKAHDLKFMGRMLASSVHFPAKIAGRPATINFWSTETDAMPPEAVTLLSEAAELMAKGR